MEKIDFKQTLSPFYRPSAKAVVAVTVPTMNYLMIDGQGDPNTSPAFQAAVEALFGLSYTIKFSLKKSGIGTDYVVMPLEGLWWAANPADFLTYDKSRWLWTLLIMQPAFVTAATVHEAASALQKKSNPGALAQVRFEAYTEGPCAQIMHLGPFATEGPTVEKVHQFIAQSGGKLRGKHHEIYLSDFRKVDPTKLKTIIRQPYE